VEVRNLVNTGTHSVTHFIAENTNSIICGPQSPGELALGRGSSAKDTGTKIQNSQRTLLILTALK